MKKILKILFVIFVCLIFASCSNSMAEESSEMKSDILVNIEVNPNFAVHINNSGTIVEIDELNNDAKKVLAEIDVTGFEYGQGVTDLLCKAYSMGYITAQSRIKMSIKEQPGGNYDIQIATEHLIMNFTKNVIDVGFDISSETVEKQGTEKNAAVQDKPEKIIDKYGNEVFYTYHANGNTATVEIIGKDGSVQKSIYDENGNVLEGYSKDNNTNTERTEKYENAVIKYVTVIDFNTNDSFTETYDSNGVIIHRRDDRNDGSYSETTYNNGVAHTCIEHQFSPAVVDYTITYHSNGITAEEIQYWHATGEEFVYRYDKNGNMTERFGYDNYGRPVHETFNRDGSSVVAITNEDGTTDTKVLDKNGNIVSE